jgi:hypothetical protein
MHNPANWRARTRSIVGLAGLGMVLAGGVAAAIGQDSPDKPAATAASQLVARLKAACASDTKLRGVLIKGDELHDGVLSLAGTIDRIEQVELIEGEARRLLDASPSWKVQIKSGVSASKMIVFPIRSDLLPRLQRDFAAATAERAAVPGAVGKIDPAGRPELLRQTRIDDLFFDVQGRLRVAGLCINEEAYLASKNPDPKQATDPLNKIVQGIRERLKGYPVPENVDRTVMFRLVAEKMRFEENPVRPLQNLAFESKLDNVLFWDSNFDAMGELTIDGLLGTEEERALAAAFVERPEIVKAYSRPDQSPPASAAAAVARMAVVPWRTALLSGLQQRFAGDPKRKGPADILRHCRLDRAFFVYAENASLKLRFEGVMLKAKDVPDSPVTAALRTQSIRFFVAPLPVKYDAQNRLTSLPRPERALQSIIASNSELDGVRLDDVTFGAEGETTLEGLWIEPAQAATLDAAITPALLEQTRGKVRGPLARRLIETPTDRLLRSLRSKVFVSSDETSLGRLFFRPAADPGSRPELVMQGATIAARLPQVRAQLLKWLNGDPLSKVVGAPVVELTPRPNGLVSELRKLVVKDPALDGVRIDHGAFNEEDVFILSGRQDHEGQAEVVIDLTEKAAKNAWTDLAAPKATKAGKFEIRPISSLLKRLYRDLPYYREADGVVLERAYYNDASELVLGGRVVGPRRDTEKLQKRIKSLMGDEPGFKLAPPSLMPQPPDNEAQSKIVQRAIQALGKRDLPIFPLGELDEAILLNASDSTAWYLRGAYYYFTNDRTLADRDLGRAHSLERVAPGRAQDRRGRLEKFQGSDRTILEDILENAPVRP